MARLTRSGMFYEVGLVSLLFSILSFCYPSTCEGDGLESSGCKVSSQLAWVSKYKRAGTPCFLSIQEGLGLIKLGA